ncbi:hypothetical protein NIASO_21020 [Niabella soli DSM 19437]|uniref:Uncharacterized protein n=1 Tax=Niabella soli DSM 19437 TaxID=929713 RepID=W0F8I1_9BACT|nr:hypothetical protein NIASO_21020 [Niabella soli DSM 19437]
MFDIVVFSLKLYHYLFYINPKLTTIYQIKIQAGNIRNFVRFY